MRKLLAFIGLLVGSLAMISCLGSTNGGALLGSSPSRIVLKSTDELYRFLTYDEQRYPLVSAHRGGPASGYPENAIETFEFRAISQPLIIECDIQLTKDSVLILMHDEKLDRTTNGRGIVREHTLEQLRALRLKDAGGTLTNYRIPTLDQALKWGKDRVIFTLDVKRGVPYTMVVAAIQRNQASPYSIVITYTADQVAEVHRLDPDLMISASIKKAGDLLKINERNIPDNRLVAFVGTSEVGKGVYDLLHGHGIMCILGTMGNLDRRADANGYQIYAELIERGADILSTDRPDEANKAMDFYRSKRKLSTPYIQ